MENPFSIVSNNCTCGLYLNYVRNTLTQGIELSCCHHA